MISYFLLEFYEHISLSKPSHPAVAKHLQCQKGTKPLSRNVTGGVSFQYRSRQKKHPVGAFSLAETRVMADARRLRI
jgi:hypothetical protein